MKRFIYFSIAALTVFTQAREAPDGGWGWAQLMASMLTGGFIALRALESSPSQTTRTDKP